LEFITHGREECIQSFDQETPMEEATSKAIDVNVRKTLRWNIEKQIMKM